MEGLNSLREIWPDMISTSTATRFFHYFQWYQSLLSSVLKDTRAIFFFTLFEKEKAVAIFPLQHKKLSISGIKFNILEIPDQDHIDLSDFIYNPKSNPRDCVTALVNFLEKQRDIPWDILRLPHLLADSPTVQALDSLDHHSITIEKGGHSDVIPCNASSYDNLLSSFSKNFRGNLRKPRNRLSKQKNVQVHSFRNEKDLMQGYQNFLEVEASGWKGKNGTGTAIKLHPVLIDFYKRLIKEFSRTGECEINLLTIDNKCIAGQFCLVVNDCLYMLKIGYDPEYSKLAPGNMLLENTITRLIANPRIKNLSLITGTKWHADWKPESYKVFRYLLFNTTLKGKTAHNLLKKKNTAKMIYRKIDHELSSLKKRLK